MDHVIPVLESIIKDVQYATEPWLVVLDAIGAWTSCFQSLVATVRYQPPSKTHTLLARMRETGDMWYDYLFNRFITFQTPDELCNLVYALSGTFIERMRRITKLLAYHCRTWYWLLAMHCRCKHGDGYN